MLLAKGYDNENSFQKNKHLRLAATYAGDRESLFLLIHNQKQEPNLSTESIDEVVVEEETIEEEKIIVQETVIEEVEEIVVEKVQEVKEKNPEVVEPEVVIDVVEEVVETKIDFEEIVTYDPIKELKSVKPPAERERTEIDFDYVAYDPETELNRLIEPAPVAIISNPA
jgi:hypothetical protein